MYLLQQQNPDNFQNPDKTWKTYWHRIF